MGPMRSVLLLLALGAGGQARAGVELGLGLDVAGDLGGGATSDERAVYGPALSVRAPIRLGLGEGLALRLTPRALGGAGQDTVLWTEAAGALQYASTDHEARVFAFELLAGPELRIGEARGARWQPLLGVGAGFTGVRMRHDFTGEAADALGDNQGSSQGLTASWVAPAAGAHAGLRWLFRSSFAFEVEAGYNVSFLKEAALEGTPESREATIAALGLDALRLGVSATFSLGGGTDR